MRLFLAIELPEAEARALAAMRRPLPGWRWVPAENLHITLVFLGDVRADAAGELDDALNGMTIVPPEVQIAGIGHFGRAAPRAVWAGVTPQPALEALANRLAQKARGAGIDVEHRKFVPHVTLARLANGTSAESVAAFAEAHGRLRLPPFTPQGVTLFRSHLRPEGPLYESLATYPDRG